MDNKYSMDSYGRVPMIFSYNPQHTETAQIKAVTIDAEGSIYLYDYNAESFRATTGVGHNFITVNYNSRRLGSRSIQLRERQLYAQYVEKYEILEKLIENHLEAQAGIQIKRVVGFKEIAKVLYIKYRFVNNKGEVDSDIFALPTHIDGYDTLKAILEKQRERSEGQEELDYSKPCRVEIACIIVFGILFLAGLAMMIHFTCAAGDTSLKAFGSLVLWLASIATVICLSYRVIRKR